MKSRNLSKDELMGLIPEIDYFLGYKKLCRFHSFYTNEEFFLLRDDFGNLWPYSLKGAEINEGHNLVLLDRNGARSTYLCLTKLKHEKKSDE